MSVHQPAGLDARHAMAEVLLELIPGREHEQLRRQIGHRVLDAVVPHIGEETRSMAAQARWAVELRRDEDQLQRGRLVIARGALSRYLPDGEYDGGYAAQRAMRETAWTAPGQIPARLAVPEASYDLHVIGAGAATGLEAAARIPATTIGEAVDILLSEYTRGDVPGGQYTIRIRRATTTAGPPPMSPPAPADRRSPPAAPAARPPRPGRPRRLPPGPSPPRAGAGSPSR